jgi:diguanylate cyclase
VLVSEDHGYDVEAGDVFAWADSFCYRMTRGLGPHMAPRSDEIPAYATAPIGRQVPIGAYIGMPLMRADGSLFGTLCAIHPTALTSEIEQEHEFVTVQARLLSTLINSELKEQITHVELDKEKRLSQIDALTGVYNRRGWENFLEIEEQRCVRYGTQAAVVILDIDDLKTINDTRGHAFGDDVLRRIAFCLTAVVRAFDAVSRIGGDEFAVLVVETDEQAMAELIDRIRVKLEAEGINASLGWAARGKDLSLRQAMDLADRRMYEDKRRHKH